MDDVDGSFTPFAPATRPRFPDAEKEKDPATIAAATGLSAKADFSALYDCPDPRPYCRTLAPLDYRTPHAAQGIFRRCVAAIRTLKGRLSATVLDLCCGYGINAALLNHDITLEEYYRHFCRRDDGTLGTAERFRADKRFFARRRRRHPARVLGVDIAAHALAYGEGIGLLDAGFAANLETTAPSGLFARELAGVDLVTVTGGLSYIGARTFGHLLDAMPRRPWIAFFPLRGTRTADLRRVLDLRGLEVETWPRPFRHRRFRDAGEQRGTLENLRARGLPTAAFEERGYLYTTFCLARPSADIARVALPRLVRPPAAGAEAARLAAAEGIRSAGH